MISYTISFNIFVRASLYIKITKSGTCFPVVKIITYYIDIYKIIIIVPS